MVLDLKHAFCELKARWHDGIYHGIFHGICHGLYHGTPKNPPDFSLTRTDFWSTMVYTIVSTRLTAYYNLYLWQVKSTLQTWNNFIISSSWSCHLVIIYMFIVNYSGTETTHYNLLPDLRRHHVPLAQPPQHPESRPIWTLISTFILMQFQYIY
jgi:hypothetical protein